MSTNKWRVYCRSGKKPQDIPSEPRTVYIGKWVGWGDWLGTGTIAPRNRVYREYQAAKSFAQTLGLRTTKEWYAFAKTDSKPYDIPSTPDNTYGDEWESWGEWLGTGNVAARRRKYRTFTEARDFVHSLCLKNQKSWYAFARSKSRPIDIPTAPAHVYGDVWKSWGDWLGTNRIATFERQYRPFQEARAFVRSLKLNDRKQWKMYCTSGQKPDDIPANPNQVYKTEWKGIGDWLGTNSIATFERKYRPFEEAREFVRSLSLHGVSDWYEYSKSNAKPLDIPSDPHAVYKERWIDFYDWLGTKERPWNTYAVKDLLRHLIESGIIYQWDEAVLYSFLLRKGLLNLNGAHREFFRNLIKASKSNGGIHAIENYANTDTEIIPDLAEFTGNHANTAEDTIAEATSDQLRILVDEDVDPLDYGEAKMPQQILSNTNILESISVDEEAIKFYVNYSVGELWKAAFENEDTAIKAILQGSKNGNKYHDIVLETFLSDYFGTKMMRIPKGYAFPSLPKLMQLHVAYKVKTNPYFGNFSGTGAGKTLSAVLASRVIQSKMTLIVCPNDIVGDASQQRDGWVSRIKEIFPDSIVTTGKDAFLAKRDEYKYQYLVLNYDKFSIEGAPNNILNLSQQKIDFVILDEIHYSKIRSEEHISQRRKNLDGLMTAVRKKNPELKVLGLSATPVVNNLMEGRSLLELITGKVYDDIVTRPTVPNAVTLYEKLSSISVRELPRYNIVLHTDESTEVEAQRPDATSIKQLKSNPLGIELLLTDARIPAFIKCIDGQTIIYTEYVSGIVEKISRAVEQAGYTHALYIGTDRSGLQRFLSKKVQVLIASRPISTGIDGLQKICNRLIINTLPWTNAQYQQLLGRLVRTGQVKDVVNVYVIKASIGGYHYDQLKMNRIKFKKTLADCAVDGRLPEKNLVTPQQAAVEAVKWLERLERGEISSVVRRDLNVELAPVQAEERIRKYGDFSKLNQQINSENSETTHVRMIKDPEEWYEYHRQYREARKTWPMIPYDVIIKRIKSLSPRLQIGDLGCGEAKLMDELGNKRVYSFDHIAVNDNVISCDMKAVPIGDGSIDVAVFSLSLMGKNWADYIQEARRCLSVNGYLLIAETAKSLAGRLANLRGVLKEKGFEIYQDEEKGDFTYIEARKF